MVKQFLGKNITEQKTWELQGDQVIIINKKVWKSLLLWDSPKENTIKVAFF
ncbi:hypothetical protein [Caldalkalibacillus mannanilyticus]|uniref:hypothetical protein n=1 Tax=Caldalkalibacillus mannanilyticus TaxID=1418 RepID=UPI000A451881|nr:hypothetical protein [Caldalkalibacillus mannanilyticus]